MKIHAAIFRFLILRGGKFNKNNGQYGNQHKTKGMNNLR